VFAPAPQGNAGGELVSSGERYLYARGVARNCDQAVIYFNAAAAQQNLQAFSHLGAMYATGECVPMDRAVAYSWFRRAYAKEPGNRYFEQNLTMLWRQMTPAERQRATGRQ
jgi:TPR repeat protein